MLSHENTFLKICVEKLLVYFCLIISDVISQFEYIPVHPIGY